MVKGYLKYDDVKIFRYENFYLSIIYTIGHIFVAMACNRIITGASLDMAAADAFVEPIINGFWFYLLLVYVKKILVNKIEQRKSTLINASQVGILLAFLYTIGHILIAMTCNRLLTGASLNLAVIDAFVEPIINGFWFYFLFEVFSKYKKKKILSGIGHINSAS